jgi:hypothetical protein
MKNKKKNNKDHGYKKHRDEAWIILEDSIYVGENSNFLNYGQTGRYNRKDSTFYPHGEDVSYYVKADQLYFGPPDITFDYGRDCKGRAV